MDSQNYQRTADYFILITLVLFGASYLFLSSYPSKAQPSLVTYQKGPSSQRALFKMNVYKDELDEVLDKASTENNKTVIIAIVNKAYSEIGENTSKSMFDLFLDGLWYGEGTRELKRHLLIVAVDGTSYARCKFLGLHCYRLETEGVDFNGEKLFMSEDFLRMMWRRTLFLGEVLKRGYNFIFTDTDILLLRNPFLKLALNETVDLQISVDTFNGDDRSEYNYMNTGFYMVRSNNKTIALFDEWYGRKDNSTGMKEQDVLEKLKYEGRFKALGLEVRFLNTLFFSGFCQASKDVKSVATVHANCCRSISAKVYDLLDVLRDWRRFKKEITLASNGYTNNTTTFNWSSRKHVACADSWTH